MKNSLKLKTVAIFTVSITILLVILGLAVNSKTLKTVTPLANSLTIEIINAKGGEVRSVINGYINQLDNISTSKFARYSELAPMETMIKDMQTSLYNDFIKVFYADQDGNAVYSTGPRNNIGDEIYFNKIVRDGNKLYITDPFIDDHTRIPMVIVTVQVENSISPGVVGGMISLKRFSELLKELNISESSFTLIADRKGNIIASSMDEYVLNLNVADLADQEDSNLLKIFSDDDKSSGRYDFVTQGENRALIFSKIKDTNWVIAECQLQAEVNAIIDKVTQTLIIGIFLTILISIFLIYGISTHAINPIFETINMAEYISNLDLSKKLPYSLLNRTDEIGNLSKSLVLIEDNLRDFIVSLGNTSDNISSSSSKLEFMTKETTQSTHRVALSINDIADGASQQALETEYGARMASEMGDSIENMVENINILTDKINNIVGLEAEGLRVVDNLLSTTNNSTRSIHKVSEGIIATDSSAEKISQATKLIRSIAEETNLLALNASIEAAHAGKTGKGFTVVANEIRILADNSAEYAADIDDMISRLQLDSQNTVKIVNQLLNVTRKQASSVETTSQTFQDIYQAIREAEAIVLQLIESTTITEERKEEIINILAKLSDIADNNASITEEIVANTEEQLAAMEEVAMASEDMAHIPLELSQKINEFKL